MAVVIETTLGDITVDLFVNERPKSCLNFIKLAKLKYYNYNLFHTVEQGFIAQTGDPTGAGDGGSSVWGVIEGSSKRFFEAELIPKIKHSEPGLLSMVGDENNMIGSQFFFTLGPDLTSLDGKHCVIGEVTEGHEVLRKIGEAICDESHRPYQDVRITHTVILEDPYSDPRGFREPTRSPSPSAERLKNGRIAADEEIDDTEGKTEAEIQEMLQEREAKARATILEIVGDIPDADIAPPENVLFVCKLNPVTTDDDLKVIFSRFGKIKTCEVIRDKQTGDSLQYAFIEYEDQKFCEEAYMKMDNVLIDDRRIHVDFSQSVSKIKWRGKGNYTILEDSKETRGYKNSKSPSRSKSGSRSRSGRRNRSPDRRHSKGSGSGGGGDKDRMGPAGDKGGNRSRYDLGNWRNDYEKYY